MSGGGAGAPPPEDAGTRAAQYVGVGCLTVPAGFFGGGMLGVAIGMIVGNLQDCVPPEGLPICNLERYLYPGAFIGLVLLPTVSLWLLRRSRARAQRNST